ncbi:MAG: amidohydrolase [Clostridiales bacterium]|nr:amidohydrolase [Clostridiales bacterium]
MDFIVVDAHVHLWKELKGNINGKTVSSIGGGAADFLGEKRQMMPPYMVNGENTVEMFVSNMNYAGVAAAVVTQEYIDGIQNKYLIESYNKYPDRLFICGMAEFRKPGYYLQVKKLIDEGFKGIKIPAQRLINLPKRVYLNEEEMIDTFKLMESKNIVLSIDLADGDLQVAELKEVIKECPNLKIAIGHFGMVGREGWQEQIKLARNKNVYIESGGITWLFHKEFYPYKGAVLAIKEAAELVGMEKLMWGSDYPRTMTAITYKMSYNFIEKSDLLSEYEKRLLLGENAIKFYGFKNLKVMERIKNMVED